jgi:hypothetical protein
MATKSTISVMPLQFWMRYYSDAPEGREENDLKRITPIVNRDGWYFDRSTGVEWYEYKGEAFLPRGKADMFKYHLQLLDAQVLTAREVAAYREMLRLRPKKAIRDSISEVLRLDGENKYLREIRQSSQKHALSFRRKHGLVKK